MRTPQYHQWFGRVLRNLARMLGFAWEASHTLTRLIDGLIEAQALGTLSIPLLILILLASRYLLNMISGIFNWVLGQVYFDHLFRYKMQNEISLAFYTKLAHLDIAHFEDIASQNLITKARDTMQWRPPDFLRYFSYFVGAAVQFVAAFIVLLPFGWWIPVVITLAAAPFMLLRIKYGDVQWSIFGSGAPDARKLWYFSWLLSNVIPIREMRIFRSAEALLGKYNDIQNDLYERNRKPLTAYTKIVSIPQILGAVLLFFIAWLSLDDVMAGAMTVGTFALFISMIESLQTSAESSVLNFGEVYSHSLYVDDYFAVLALPKLIQEKEHPHVFENIEPPTIEFRNVSFAYANGKQVLKNVSFVIKPGESVALVGENGAGKSTIIKLLCRFYDVTSGEILINGVNLKDLKLANWYAFLGTLFQDFVWYHFTVRENIGLGDPSRNNEEEIVEAAKKSGAYEFIKKLPQGFDTPLGREFVDGEELSTGQWQKLAIARAFYENAPVLIMDEPTSAIDAEAEYEIFENLEKSYGDRTLILVSHRFSTVRNADMILVVEHGEITERGSHEELLKKGGRYANMFHTQAKGYQ
jgi:ABC-type multidrug transport system fused ATPase/permease subunit